MTGYIRQDTLNLISNGTTVDALPLDQEFDALQSTFAAVGGHKHDGTTGEGAPITVVGPLQDLVVSGSSVSPKTDNTLDLGTASLEFKDLYIDGVANIDSLVADTADINSGTIDGTTIGATTPSTGVFTTLTASSVTGPLTGNAATATKLQTPRNITLSGDVTGSVSFDGSANVTLTSTVLDNSHNHTSSTITDLGNMALQNSDAVSITGGAISGVTISGATVSLSTDLAVADGGTGASTAVNARSNLGLVIGTDVQAYSAALASIAGLTTSANKLPYATASNTYTTTDLSSYGRSLIALSNESAFKAFVNLESDVDFQSYNARLFDISSASWSAGDLMYFNGTNLVRLPKGLKEQTLKMNSGATAPEWASTKSLYATESQATNVASSVNLLASSWVKRLVATQQNTVTGASISSGVLTLPAGTYSASALAKTGVNRPIATVLRLRDTTNSVTLLTGVAGKHDDEGGGVQNQANASLNGIFSVTSTVSVELQQWSSINATGGSAINTGENEVYATLALTLLGP